MKENDRIVCLTQKYSISNFILIRLSLWTIFNYVTFNFFVVPGLLWCNANLLLDLVYSIEPCQSIKRCKLNYSCTQHNTKFIIRKN